jgi:hypothetical protein
MSENPSPIKRVKTYLANQLTERVRMIVGDCETFSHVRIDKHEWFEELHLGGGNYVMTLALFALLDLLAQIHKMLQTGKVRRSNETAAFGQLVQDVGNLVNLGCSTKDDGMEIWKDFRNKLAHMASPSPYSTVGVWGHIKELETYESWKEKIIERPVFIKYPTGTWQCDADRLTFCVPQIAQLIHDEIAKCEDEALLREMVNWIRGLNVSVG